MDIWTFFGQVVNFIVFVAVLYYLLYRPVGRIMRARKDEMEAELVEAREQRAQAERIRAEGDKLAREFERERDHMLAAAREQARLQGQEILDEAERGARERLDRFRRIMEQERHEVIESVSGRLRDTITSVTVAVLSDVSGPLMDRGIDRVETMLDGLSDEDAAGARRALEKSRGLVNVRAAGRLGDAQRERIIRAVGSRLGVQDLRVEAVEDSSLVAGLSVAAGHVSLEAHWRRAIDEALEGGAAQGEGSG